MSTPNHTEEVLSAKESLPTDSDDVEDHAVTSVRNTDLELRENKEEKVIVYLKGWRLHVLTVACEE